MPLPDLDKPLPIPFRGSSLRYQVWLNKSKNVSIFWPSRQFDLLPAPQQGPGAVDAHFHLHKIRYDLKARRGMNLRTLSKRQRFLNVPQPPLKKAVDCYMGRVDKKTGKFSVPEPWLSENCGDEFLWSCTIHPNEAGMMNANQRDESLDSLFKTMRDTQHFSKLVAIGEFGLDYFRCRLAGQQEAQRLFIEGLLDRLEEEEN